MTRSKVNEEEFSVSTKVDKGSGTRGAGPERFRSVKIKELPDCRPGERGQYRDKRRSGTG